MLLSRRELLGLLGGCVVFLRRLPAVAQSVAAAHRPINRIAFGSCAFQWEEQPIWSVIAERDPDLFLFVGDAIYGDFDGKKPFTPTADTPSSGFASKLLWRLRSVPGQQRKSSVALGMSAPGGTAEVDFGRLKVRS
jgi:hypothetical protein